MKAVKLTWKQNVLFLVGIIAADLVSGILNGSVFRYLFVVALLMALIRFIFRGVKFYDSFTLFVVYGVKGSVELLIMLAIIQLNLIITLNVMVIVSISLLILPITLSYFIKIAYSKIESLWKAGEAFYLRYILCVLMICGIMIVLKTIVIDNGNKIFYIGG